MDGTSFIALAAACAPLVDPSTAHAIVAVESAFNPHAIGVVFGVLERQPRNTSEAIALARALRDNGWSFSVGLAQINAAHLPRLGLSIPTAFEPCRNLNAMQTVLRECAQRVGTTTNAAQPSLRRTLSCYYSGNAATGIRQGYVARVVHAAAASQAVPRAPP